MSELHIREPYVERLHDKIKLCDEKMKPYLSHSKDLIEQYTGPYFWMQQNKHEPLEGERLVLPGFFAYINSVMPYLATTNPKVNVTAVLAELKFFAERYEGAGNYTLKEINFIKSLQRMVLDSLFGFGLGKTGLNEYADDTSPDGFLHDKRQFYADRVDPKNFVYDSNAAEWEKMFFVGHRFTWPVDFCRSLAADGVLSPVNVRRLIDEQDGAVDDDLGNFKDIEPNSDRLDPHLRLIEIWEPRENRLKIISDTESEAYVLSDVEYTGPERGPYVLLGYHFVPGEILPLPPLSVLKELDQLNNDYGIKLYNRTQSEKSIGLIEDGVDKKTKRAIKNSRDGDWLTVPDGTISGNKYAIENMTGITPAQTQLSAWLQEQMNIFGANFQTLGGTKATSRTATQDQQLLNQASKTVNAMQEKVQEFSKEIVEKMAWYLWKQTGNAIPLTQMIAGQLEDMPFDPAMKEGDFLDYTFDIEPYSAASKDPARLFADKMMLSKEIIIPTSPVAMEQGDAPNIRELVRMLADHLDVDVDEIYQAVIPSQQATQPTGTATQGAQGGSQTPSPQPQASTPGEVA